MISTGAA